MAPALRAMFDRVLFDTDVKNSGFSHFAFSFAVNQLVTHSEVYTGGGISIDGPSFFFLILKTLFFSNFFLQFVPILPTNSNHPRSLQSDKNERDKIFFEV
jgi:hypothetical protein